MKAILPFASSILFAITVTAVEAQPVWLAFPSGVNFDLTEQGDVASVRVPVAPLPNAPALAKLRARLRDVVYHNGRPEAIAPSFEADIDEGDAHHGSSLVVKVKGLDTSPGSYVLTLELVRADPNTNQPETPQAVTLTLQRPAPEIVVGPPPIVDQVRWFGKRCSHPSLLLIEERSGKSSLTGVQFTQTPDPPPNRGELEIILSNNLVPLRTPVQAAIRAIGTFPLGKSTGKIQIRGRELEQPLVVTYEVHSRRTPIWIALLVGLGFGTGYLVRNLLRKHQEVAMARVAASDTLKALNEAEGTTGDAIFRHKVAVIRTEVIRAGQSTQVSDIQAGASKGLRDLADAQRDLAERVAKLQELVQPLFGCLHQKWRLPALLNPALLNATAQIDAVADLAKQQNAEAASARIEVVLENQLLDLINALGAWQNATGRYFANLSGTPPPVNDLDRLREATAAWTRQYGVAADNYSKVNAEQLSTALNTANTAYHNALGLADYVRESAGKLLQVLDDQWQPTDQQQRTDLDQVKQESLKAATAVKEDLDDPKNRRPTPAERHRTALAVWQSFLLSLVPASVDPTSIRYALTSNQWIQAIQLTMHAIAGDKKPDLHAIVAPERIPKLAAAPAKGVSSSVVFAVVPVSPDGTLPLVLTRTAVLSGSAVEREYLLRQAAKASFWQSVFFGGLFMLVAYALYEKTWIGTLYEMLAIFIWAFGVDLTSDAVMNAARKIKLPEP